MKQNIRLYFESSGKIYGFDNCSVDAPPMHAGAAFIIVPLEDKPDETSHIVDPESLCIRKMNAGERRVLNAPNEMHLRVTRDIELLRTDWRDKEPVWALYRQALRDITKAGEAVEMFEAWPLRPDGSDALAKFRILAK